MISTYNDIETTYSASKWCDIEVLIAHKGGRKDRHTASQDFPLRVATKFSREFHGLIGSRKKGA